MTDELSKLMN